MLPDPSVLSYCGRNDAASPAPGSKHLSDTEDAQIISRAMDVVRPRPAPPAPQPAGATPELAKVAQGPGVGGD
jgi:hypothetical protein